MTDHKDHHNHVGDEESDTESAESNFVAQKRRQILAAGIATIGAFGLGNVLAWSSPALPDMEKSGDLGDITTSKTWMASLTFLGALLSSPAAGYLMNKVGRKQAMIRMAVPFVLGWFIMALAYPLTSVYCIYIGRVITGFSGASYLVFVPVYVGEIAHMRIRGALATTMILMLVAGILFTFIIGTFVSWATLSLICGLVPVFILAFLPFMPETPRYWISQNEPYKALKSLQWLRGAETEDQVRPELQNIENSFRVDKEDSSRLKDLFVSSSLKPTLIGLALFFFQQMSGANAVSLYTVDVFKSTGTELNANLASIIVASCQFATVILSTFLVDRVGRKVLLIVSEIVMILSLCALGIFFYMKENQIDSAINLNWLPLPSFISFIIGYNIGMGPIPWLVISELLPSQSRGLATSVVTSFYWIISFVTAKTFGDLVISLGWATSYVLFAVICFIGTLFIFFLIPETKDRTIEEIELHFNRKSTVKRLSLRSSNLGGNNEMGEVPTAGVTNTGFQASEDTV